MTFYQLWTILHECIAELIFLNENEELENELN